MNLRHLRLFNKFENQIPFESLESAYLELCAEQSAIYPEIRKKTLTENIVNSQIRKYTKLKYERSFWIGNNNFDFFFPGIGGKQQNQKKFRGVVIEMNGPIHDSEFKMKQDEYKLNFIHSLGIITISCENKDIKNGHFQNTLKNLKQYPRLDSRAKKRLMRDIYIATILKQENKEFLITHFGKLSLPLWKKLRIYFKQMRSVCN